MGEDFIVCERYEIQCFIRPEVFTAVTVKNAVFWDIKYISSYLTGDTLRLCYIAQSVNAM
jgi:hypothetical protein